MGFEVNTGDEQLLFKKEYDPARAAGGGIFGADDLRTEHMDVATPFGNLKATAWSFDGIRITYSEVGLDRPAELDWKGDDELITMHFNLEGRVSMSDERMPGNFELSGNQHNMFYGREASGKMRFDGSVMRSFLVQLSKDSYIRIAKDGNDAIRQFSEKIMSGNPVAFSNTNLDIDIRLHNCIRSVLGCQYTDALKRMFFFSRTIEMLVLQADAFDKAFNVGPQYIRSDYDRERIFFARDFLLKNIDSPPTLSQLAREAGLNEFKLKKGFRETFNKTVFEYLSDIRLGNAKASLSDPNRSVTDIACELGYSSVQHFSTAFKKKFGVSPSKMK